MNGTELMLDAFGRVREDVLALLSGLSEDDLAHRPTPDANSIAWLVWHLTRVQDLDLLDAIGGEQVWTSQGYDARFGLPPGINDHGYGHTSEEVGKVRADADLLAAYFEGVHDRTVSFLRGLGPSDYDRVVDERWDPPVTLGVRLVSVLNDDMQHAGQAAYVRGLLGR
jgi:Protein of unknown function (DUF664)